MHGTLVRPQGVGGEVAQPLGYFYGLKYQPQTTGGRVGGRYLTRPYELTTSTTSMPADGSWFPLISQAITVESDEFVKLSGATLFEHAGVVNDKVTTNMILRVRNQRGDVVAQSPISYKHLSRNTKYNTLRSDMVIAIAAGDYDFEMLANCPFSGSPTVIIDPSGTKLYYEGFALPEGVPPLDLEQGGGAAMQPDAAADNESLKKTKRRPQPPLRRRSIQRVEQRTQSILKRQSSP